MTSLLLSTRFYNWQLLSLGCLWAGLWFSLNAEARIPDGSLISQIHAIRFLFPYMASVTAVFWLVLKQQKPVVKLWQIGLSGFAIVVLMAGHIHGTSFEHLHFHAAILCAVLVTILGTSLPKMTEEINESDPAAMIAATGLIILTAVVIAFFIRDFTQALQSGLIQGYAIQPHAPTDFGMETPRPTGQARSAAIVGIALLGVYGSGLLRSKWIWGLAAFCFALVMFYQARGTIVALTATFIAFQFSVPKTKRLSMVSVIKFFGLAALILGLIVGILMIAVDLQTTSSLSSISGAPAIRNLMPEQIGSGRLQHWQNGIQVFLQSPLWGYGSQADRIFLDQNVSSMFVYTLMCGGLFGFSCVVIAIFRPIVTSIQTIVIGDKSLVTHRPELIFFAIPLFVFISTRGIFENAYSLFNIDFLLIVPVLWLFHKGGHQSTK